MTDRPDNPPDGQPRHRRPRYHGTHPTQFDQKYKELAPEKYPEIHGHVRSQGRTPAGTHVPVLVAEVLEALRPAPGDTVVDCTIGYGGHAAEFLKRIGPTGRLIGLDVDEAELERTRRRLAGASEPADAPQAVAPPGEAAKADPCLILRRASFAGIDRVLAAEHIPHCNVILADLGVSSMQLDDPSRGFSYKHDGPLDMRMGERVHMTAADLLNRLSEEGLSAALVELADEPDHAQIAHQIVEERRVRPIATTSDLVQIIFAAKDINERQWQKARQQRAGAAAPAGHAEDLHPAALTFQALRILVNDEIGALRQLLRVAPACLAPGGRIGVISFHSGEDRAVKLAFRDGVREGVYAKISYDVIRPSPTERHDNPRSASAKLRWAVRSAE
jgi:16S rRNA (cytosine1402-N4)-methyltransferase